MEWKDVKLSLLGKEIDFEPIDYIDEPKDVPFTEYVGNITITKDEFSRVIPKLPIAKKITNFQRKKMWKRFYRTFGLTEEQIRMIL